MRKGFLVLAALIGLGAASGVSAQEYPAMNLRFGHTFRRR